MDNNLLNHNKLNKKEILRNGVLKYFLAVSLFILPLLLTPLLFAFIASFPQIAGIQQEQREIAFDDTVGGDVLAETDATDSARVQFNVDTVFNDNVFIDGELLVQGRTIFSGAVEAPNLIYEITTGEGLELTGDQNVTLVNTGVVSIQGEAGAIEFEEGAGIGLDGLTITNTGVTSFNGQTGAVTLEGGPGISVDGTTVSLDSAASVPAFATVSVTGQEDIEAEPEDTLTFVPGSGIVLSTNTTNKELTISATAQDSGWQTTGSIVSLTNPLARVGIGTASPVSIFSVGSGSQFQVNAAGAVVASTGLTSSGTVQFTGLTNGLLKSNASGVLGVAVAGTDYESPITFGSGLTRTGNNVTLGPLLANWNQTNAFDIVLANPNAELQIMGSNGSFYGTIDTGALTANRSFTFPDEGGTICIAEAGNCAGAGGGVTTLGGTTNRLARFSAASTLEDGSINDLYTGGVGITIDTDGDVGFGITNPGYSIEASGDIKVGNGSNLILGQAASDPGTAPDGSLYYNTTQNRFRCREAGSWKYCDTSVSGGSISGSGATGQISFFDSTSTITGSTSLFWDAANNRLGIGDDTPTATFTVGAGDAFQVNSSGAIAAATGITSSGTVTLSDLNGGGIVKAGAGTGTLSVGTIDLTSEVSGVLPIANGGTGTTTFTDRGVLYGNGSNALLTTSAPTAGQLLLGSGLGVPTFTSMSGDATLSGTGVLTLSSTGVTANTYGNATTVPQITVDAKGRITAVSAVTISALQSGDAAGGDLSGTYPNPTVSAINGATLGTTTATAGNLLIGSGSQWESTALSGDATVNATGVLTIGNDAVLLGTDTVGNYVAAVSGGSGITASGSGSENASVSLALGTLSTDWNQTAAFDIILNNADSQLQIKSADGAGFFGTLDVGTLTANRTYILPDTSAASAEICLSTGNCSSAGGGVTTLGGTTNQLAKFTGSQTLGNSIISDDGTTVTIAGNLSTTGTINGATISGGTLTAGTFTGGSVSGGSLSGGDYSATGFTVPASYLAQIGDSGSFSLQDASSNTLFSVSDNGTTGVLTVNTLSASNIGGFTATGNITGSGSPTISGFGTINGATISGGSLSGGSLTGGTYTNSGFEVTGSYQAQIGNAGVFSVFDGTNTIFSLTDGGTAGNLSNIGNITASGTITFSNIGTGVVRSTAGVLSTGEVVLGTDTSGNYVATVGGGSGISVSGSGSETAAVSLALGALTGDWSQTGAYDIVLNNADSQLQMRSADGAGFYGTLDVGTLTANRTYTLPDISDPTAEICLSTGNCSSAGGGVTTTGGTTNRLARFSDSQELETASIADTYNGVALTIGATGNLGIGDTTPTALLTVGNGDTFQVNSTGAIAAATGITSSGSITFSGLSTGVVQSNASGTLSSAALNLAGGSSYITGTLPVGNGGTGSTSFTSNGVVLGNATSGLLSTAAPTIGQILLGNSSGVPTFTSVSGDIAINATGAVTVQPNAVALGADTTGNFVGSVAGGSGISVTGSGAENAAVSLGLAPLTEDWNQSGAYDIVLANANAELRILESLGDTYYGTLDVADLSENRTYTLPSYVGDATQGIICLSSGNCASSGGGVTTSGGTTNQLAKFTDAQTIADSIISDDGTIVTVAGNLATSGNLSATGTVTFSNLGSGIVRSTSGVISAGSVNLGSSDVSGTLPVTRGGTGTGTFTANGVVYGNGTSALQTTSAPAAAQILLGNASGVPTFSAVTGDISINSSGVTAVQPDAVVLGTDTTGNFVADVSSGNGIGVSGVAGEGWNAQLDLTDLTGNWNQTGAFDIVLNNAASDLSMLEDDGASPTYFGTLTVGDLSASNKEYVFPDFSGTSADICLSTGNCASSGGGVTTSGGTVNTLAKFTSGQILGNSLLTDNGTVVTVGGNFATTGTATFSGNVLGSGSPTISGFGTINGATLSGGTLSAGTFSGGSVSGGSLTGGTYTNAGLTVSGSYAVQIANAGTFTLTDGTNTFLTITDGGSTGDISGIGTLGSTFLTTGSNAVNVAGASTVFQMDGTTIVDASRNITNVSDITASGTLTLSNLATDGPLFISSGAVNSEASLDETRGGTGQTTYATGDILYASGADTLGRLTAGTDGKVLTVVGGIPSWTDVSGGSGGICTNCIINDPSTQQTITPTADITGLSIAQASGGTVADIFTVTNTGGTIEYLQVDASGNTTVANNLTIASTTANADSFTVQPYSAGAGSFEATLTTVDLTADRSYTFPDVGGTICLAEAANCAGTGGGVTTGGGTANRMVRFSGSQTIENASIEDNYASGVALTISAAGNLGVGVTPTYALESSGDIKVGDGGRLMLGQATDAFESTAEGTSAPDGSLYYNSTQDRFRCREAGTWKYCDTSITGSISGTGSTGQISFFTGTSTVTGSNNFFWDNSLGRLGVGTNTPLALFSVGNSSQFQVNNSGTITSVAGITTTGNLVGSGTPTISGFGTINGATISGGTLSAGSFTGGSVSGGALTGGTYSATGATVTGGYTLQIGSTNAVTITDGTDTLLTIADGGAAGGNLSGIQNLTAGGTVTFSGLSSGVVKAGSGGALSTGAVVLGTETSGNYVASVSNGNGITGGDGGSAAAGLTLALGNLTSDWTQSGAFDIILNNADSQLQIKDDSDQYYATFNVSALTANKTYTFPDYAGAATNGIVCLTSGNCSGTGAAIGGEGTSNRLARFSDQYNLEESSIDDYANSVAMTITSTGNIGVGDTTPASLFTVGTGDLFQVNSSGAIAAATGITSSGTVTFSDIGSGIVKSTAGTLSTGTVNLTSEVSGVLPVANGGTGASSLTSKGVLYGNGTGTVQATTAGTGGQVLIANATGTPTFTTLSGDVLVNSLGATTIQADAVALGTDTTGNFVATVTGGSGIGISGSGTEAAGVSVALGALTTDWNQTGAFDIVLANVDSQFQIMGNDGVSYGTMDVDTLTADRTYTFPNASGTVCLDSGNCDGAGSSVTVSSAGTSGRLARFSASQSIENASINDLYSGVALTISAAGNLGIGDTSPSALLTVGNGDAFQVNSTGAIAAATGITSSGTVTFSGLGTGVVQSNASGVLSSGALNLGGGSNFVNGILPVANGGTGLSTAASNGQLLIGNGTGYTLSTLTAGTGINISNGSGTITVTNNGVTGLTGTPNQVLASAGTGAVTLSLPQNIDTNANVNFDSLTVDAQGGVVLQPYGAVAGNTSELRFRELAANGSNYVGFKAPSNINDGTGSVIWTLPAADGSANFVLTTDGAGNLSWSNADGVVSGDISAVGSVTSGAAFADASADNQWLGLGASNGRIEFDDQLTDEVNILGANVGIDTSTPNALLSVGSSSQFQVNSTGAIAAATGITSTGTINFTSLNTGGIVKAAATTGQLSVGAINLASSEVTGTLPVGNGGTGATTLTSNGVLYGNGTGAIQSTSAPTAAQVLLGNASGIPTFTTLTGDVTVNASGTTAIQANAVALGGDTVGNYVSTITGGNGVGVTGSGSETAAVSLALGNLSANWNQTGAFDIVLNNAAAELSILESVGGTYFATLDAGDLSGNKSYILPNFTGTSAEICLTTGNCAGAGNGVTATTAGTAGRLARFTAGQNIGDASIADAYSGVAITIDVDGDVGIGDTTPAAPLTVGSGDAFQVNSSGAIAAATGITSSGTVTFSGLGTGVVQSNAGGVLSSAALNLGGGSNYVSGILPVGNGGTGASTFTSNGILYGNAGGAIQVTAAGTSGQILLANGTGVPTFTTVGGDATINASGTIAIGADAVALGTDTTGAYVATVAGGNGVGVTGSGAETAAVSLALGNLSADWNQTGAFDIVLNNAASDLSMLEDDGVTPTYFGTITVGDLTASNKTYTLPDFSGTAAEICLDSGNCASAAGGVTVSSNGTANTIAMFTGSQTIANSLVSQDALATTVSVAGNLSTSGTVNGATISGGTLSGGSLSGGSLSGGTYSDTGVTVSGSYAMQISNTGTLTVTDGTNTLLTVADGGTSGNLSNIGSVSAQSLNLSNNTNQITLGTTNTGTISMDTLTTNHTYTFPNETGEICLDSGNCSGAGGGVTVSSNGTANTIAMFTADQEIANSILSQDGAATYVSVGGDLRVSGLNAGGVVKAAATTGQLSVGAIDLTSEVSGTLPVGNGGTGATTLTSNGVLYGNGTGAVQATAAGTDAQILMANGSGVPGFVSVSGDITLANTGAATIGADAVALGTDTTGNYVSTIASGNGIGVTGSGSETAAVSLALGNLSADWNQTGAFDIVLNNAAAELSILESVGGTYFATLDAGDLSGNKSYILPNFTGTSAEICLTTGNCSGAGGGVTVSSNGTANTIAMFTAGQEIANSILSQDGGATYVSVGGDLRVTGLNAGGVVKAAATTGQLSVGAIDLTSEVSGILPIANGGTGVSTAPTTGQILIGRTDGTYALNNLTPGTGISITNGEGTISVNNDGVTALAGTANQIIASGSTGSVTLSLPQNINTDADVTFDTLTLGGTTGQAALTLNPYGTSAGETAETRFYELTANGSDYVGFKAPDDVYDTDGSIVWTLPDRDGSNNYVLTTDGNGNLSWNSVTGVGGGNGTVSGTGTQNYLTRWSSGGANIEDSIVYSSDTQVGIGTGSPTAGSVLDVRGGVRLGANTGAGNLLNTTAGGTAPSGYLYWGDRTLCDSTGNCASSGGGVTVSSNGTQYTLPMFTGSQTIANSVFSQNAAGTIAAIAGDLSTSGTINSAIISGGSLTGGTYSATGATVTGGYTLQVGNSSSFSITDGTDTFLTLADGGAGGGNLSGLQNLTAGGTITFSGLGTGVIQSNASGVLSSAALNLGGGSSYITGTLPVGNGGTGATTLTSNGVLYGNGTGAVQATAAGTDAQILMANGSGVPGFVNVSGDITLANTGAATIGADAVALGTDTTGNYVSTIASGNGIGVTGSGSETAAVTLALGNLSADWSQTGAFDIILDNADSQLQIRSADGAGFYGSIDMGTLTANKTYTFPSITDPSAEICLSTGNCSGAGGGVTVDTTGTDNRLVRFTGDQTVENASINDLYASGVAITIDADGDLGIGDASPTANLGIVEATDKTMISLNNTFAGANTTPQVLVTGDNIGDSILQAGLASDTERRFNLTANGTIEFGAGGSTARDTNLYRSAANTLRTDDIFTVNGNVSIAPAGAISGATGFASSGNIDLAALSAGGIVKAAATTGRLSIAVAGTDYQAPLTFGDLSTATTGVSITGGTGAVVGSGTSISIATAASGTTGLLSGADWDTFNGKENALTFSTGLTRTVDTITANLSTGLAGGQTVYGGTAAGETLTLASTTNATKGKILFGTSAYDEVTNRLGINTDAPNYALDVNGDVKVADESMMILGSAATANAPAGVDGAMYFDTDLNKFRCYSNSAWADCGGSTVGSGTDNRLTRWNASGDGIEDASIEDLYTGGVAMTLDATGNLVVNGAREMRLQDSGSNYIGFKAPATVTTSYTLELPAAIGNDGQALVWDTTTGAMIWSDVGSGDGNVIQGGNSFGEEMIVGTNDMYNLSFETNGVSRMTIDTSGIATISGGNLFLGTDESVNGLLTFYSSGVGETDPTIQSNASGDLLIGAPTGVVNIGSGTGDITLDPGVSNLVANLSSTGNFLIQDNGTTFVTFDSTALTTTFDFTGTGTDALAINANALTSGNALNIMSTSTDVTSGKLINAILTGAGDSTAFTGAIANLTLNKTITGGTALDNTGSIIEASRNITLNNTGETATISGDAFSISDSFTQTDGTLSITGNVGSFNRSCPAGVTCGGALLKLAASGTGTQTNGLVIETTGQPITNDIVLQNGETISNAIDGSIQLSTDTQFVFSSAASDPASGINGAMYYNTTDGSLRCYQSGAWGACGGGGSGGGSVVGTGTTNYLTKWNSSGDGITDSQIFDNGTNVGIGTGTPSSLFSVGASSQFQVATDGNLAKIRNVDYLWPNAAPSADGQILVVNIDGTMSWTNPTTGTGNGDINDDGNAFGENVDIGTDDAFDLNFETNNITRMTVDTSGNVGIGTTSPAARLDVVSTTEQMRLGYDASNYWAAMVAADGGITLANAGTATDGDFNIDLSTATDGDFSVNNNDLFVDTSTGNVGINTAAPSSLFEVNDSTTTTGNLFTVNSTSTSFASGALSTLSWNPGSATNSTGDLLKLSINDNANIGNFLNIVDNNTSVFSVSESAFTTSLPTTFTAPGDLSLAYDLQLTNQTIANINSAGPLVIAAGETFESNDLTLRTYNNGNLILDAGGDIELNDNLIPLLDDTHTLGSTTNRWMDLYLGPASIHIGTDGDEGIISYDAVADAFNFDVNGDGIIDTIFGAGALTVSGSNVCLEDGTNCPTGGSGSFWTRNGSTGWVYPATLTDKVSIGSSSVSSNASLAVAGGVAIGANWAADTVPANGLIVEGNLGIGDKTPASALTVGDNDRFQVNSTGDIIRIDGVTYDFPSSIGSIGHTLTITGSGGVLGWQSPSSSDTWLRNSANGYLYPNTATDKLAIGAAFTNTPKSALSVRGGVGIGTTYAQDNAAGNNNLLVEGKGSFGTVNQNNTLNVNGNMALGTYTGNNAPTNGLIVSGAVGIGTNSPGTGLTLDVNGRVRVNLDGTATNLALCHTSNSTFQQEIVDCSSTPQADYMEMYAVADDVEMGDIVAVSDQYITTESGDRIAKMVKTTNEYQKNVIGIISDINNAGDFNSIGHNIRDEHNPLPIALSGRVPVKVDANSAPILPGDYVTTSPTSGHAMKAEKAGYMVGKALEAWTPTSGKKMVMVFVNYTYADPAGVLENLMIDGSGAVTTKAIKAESIAFGTAETDLATVIDTQSTALLEQTTALSQVESTLTSRIDTIETEVASLSAQLDTLVSETTVTDVSSLETDIETLFTRTDDLDTRTATLEAEIASLSARLTDSVLGLNDTASTGSGNLATDSATLTDLLVSGNTNLNNVGIIGTLSAGNLMIEGLDAFGDSAINTLGGTLKLQSLGANGIELVGGKIEIDTSGNIITTGSITAEEVSATTVTAENVTTESVTTATAEATLVETEKVTIKTTDAGSASAGKAVIVQGDTTVVIETTAITENSLVFVTATTKTGQQLAVTEQLDGTSFTVEVPAVDSQDISFNWWIVDQVASLGN